jgi:hypothetical protein
MTNPTNPFNWQMPTASDLVTDLPADFEVFGQAVATSMADLLGGTTGQVLSKTSNTDMDFTWVTSDDANAIQNTIVDAKGDLIGATAADTPARLAVGTNGQVLTADSTAATGLAWATASSGSSYVAGKNFLINGGMDIWQRGTSIAFTSTRVYTTDRFQALQASGGNCTVSRQATGDTTNLPNIQYAARVGRDSGTTQTGAVYFAQTIETINSVPLAGQTVTISFYARKGANFSATSDILNLVVATGTGTNENILAGFTGSATPISTTKTLTSTWQKFSASATLAATTTEIGFYVYYTPTGTAGAADYLEITGVQLEKAASASDFSRVGGTIALELAACQRYYWRQTGKSGNYSIVGNGFGNTSGTQMILQIKNPVELRVEASSIDSSGLLGFNGNSLTAALTSITLDYANQTYSNFKGTVTCDAKAPYALILDIGTNKYIGFSAEL